jgi:SagB-type dehydrogenase family enzyme
MSHAATHGPDWLRAAQSDLLVAHSVRPVSQPSESLPGPGGLLDLLPEGTALDRAGPADVPVTDTGPSRPMQQVLAERRSTRTLAPVLVSTVGTVMARAGLSRRSATDLSGATVSSRPAPSAGARHPFTLVLIAGNVIGLGNGVWALDPDRATLRPTRHTESQRHEALQAIAEALCQTAFPPAAVLAVAHPLRTLTRYPNGMSLLWRDAGALLATLHLIATDLGLGSCLVGTTGILHTHHDGLLGPVDVGAVAVGALP